MSVNTRIFLVAGLLVGLGLAVLVSPFASSSPDGLERVAAEEGFDRAAQDHHLATGPMADYQVGGVDDERVSTALAGLVGTLVTLGVGLALFGVLRVAHDRSTDAAPG